MERSRRESVVREMDTITAVDYSPGSRSHEPEGPIPERGWVPYGWLFWENRALLRKAALRALIISTLIAFLIPNTYESTSRIMPPDNSDAGTLLALLAGRASGSGGGSAGGLASLAGGLLGMKTPGALFVDLAHSQTVQNDIVDRLNLQKVYGTRYKQDARKTLDSVTSVEEDRKSGVISISVTDRSPQRARDIAQAYVQELDRLVSQVSTSSARRERIFIEQRMASVKTDLEDAEKQFSAFASQNNALDLKEQTKTEVEAAAMLQGQLIAAQSELQGLEQIYTDNNVRVRSLRARIAELQRQVNKAAGVGAVDSSDSADASQDLYPAIKKLPLLGVQWTDLYRRVKIQETVYELLNQQYELTRIQEAKEIPTIRVVDPADLPEKKSSPHRLLILLSLTTGVVLATGVWIVASRNWAAIDPGDPGKLLALSVWESIRVRYQRIATALHFDQVRAAINGLRRNRTE